MISDEHLQSIVDNPSLHTERNRMIAAELLALRKALEGWKLVPVEPNRQMMAQGHFAMAGTDRGKFRRIYQAMVAAAPTPHE